MEKRSEYIKCKFETRVEEKQEGGKKLVLRGYPILFNTETKIYDWFYGEVRETILPTALDKTDLTDVYLLTGHNPDNLLGRTGVNMRVEVDDVGLFFECELPNTQLARDIYNLVEMGILDGMSFGFTCSDEVNCETKTRTITCIDELFEITITPFPAYKEASVVVQNKRAAEAANKKEAEEQLKAEEEAKAREEAEAEKERKRIGRAHV